MNKPAQKPVRRISWRELAEEPFRLFFPAAVLAGVLGVASWPLHFAGFLANYPGAAHARLMTYGFFGGLILGFLGTALPRLLGAAPLRQVEVAPLLLAHLAMTVTLFSGGTRAGDWLLLILVALFLTVLARRIVNRRNFPPPAFVLVLLAFGCLITGTLLSLWLPEDEPPLFSVSLQHLLCYQGFVLLPILGVGAFLFPRFFGLPNRQELATSARTPPEGWGPRACTAGATGLLVIASFVLEASGWARSGLLLRLVVSCAYLWREVPLHRAYSSPGVVAHALRVSLGLILAGFAATLLIPAQRVALLHLTLIGGFALTALVVATRVVFGHSGQLAELGRRNRWLVVAVGLMLAAMLTRVTGDLVPRIRVSHYNYGAALWILGAALWSWKVLPKVRWTEPD